MGGGAGLTKFLCQVALSSQLALVVFIVIIAFQRQAVIWNQAELGLNQRKLSGAAAGQGFKHII